jgi:hypothetical protein
MKVTVKIEYNWSDVNNVSPIAKHHEALEEDAMDRILYMMNDGYTSGDLNTSVRIDDEDGEDGVEYWGHWSITTEKF